MLTRNALLLTSFAVLGLVPVDSGGHTSGSTTDTTTSGPSGPTGPTTGAGGMSGAVTSVGSTGGGSTGTGTGAGGSTGECVAGVDGNTLAGNWRAIGTRVGGPPLELLITVDAQLLAIQQARGT